MLSVLLSVLVPQIGTPVVMPDPTGPCDDGSQRPNIVLIVADDLGVDMVRAYGEASAPPCTPHIDSLAVDGVLFRNAWANPVCSPSRAALLTGRYGFRTGIGTPGGGGGVLGLGEWTLPEMLTGYESACTGKWHVGGSDPRHPNLSGFDYFAGILGGSIISYESWTKVVNGDAHTSTDYVTRDTTDEAIGRIRAMQSPWFLYVPYFAPHVPFHEPPVEYCQSPQCLDTHCGQLPADPSDAELAKAMVEVLDAEVGRLLAEIEQTAPNTIVFFLGDNGTAQAATEAPFVPSHAKGTPYEGGVNVPLIVRGPGIATGECRALIGITDLFATVAELACVDGTAEDSVSFVPCLADPALSGRATVYAEQFTPNNSAPPFLSHDRTVRDRRYKLIRRMGAPDELYDLRNDPFEQTNLFDAGLTLPQREAFGALEGELVALGVD